MRKRERFPFCKELHALCARKLKKIS